jgi:hypothetical protein
VLYELAMWPTALGHKPLDSQCLVGWTPNELVNLDGLHTLVQECEVQYSRDGLIDELVLAEAECLDETKCLSGAEWLNETKCLSGAECLNGTVCLNETMCLDEMKRPAQKLQD